MIVVYHLCIQKLIPIYNFVAQVLPQSSHKQGAVRHCPQDSQAGAGECTPSHSCLHRCDPWE